MITNIGLGNLSPFWDTSSYFRSSSTCTLALSPSVSFLLLVVTWRNFLVTISLSICLSGVLAAADLVTTDVAYLWIGDSSCGEGDVVFSRKPSFGVPFDIWCGNLSLKFCRRGSSCATKPSCLEAVGAWDCFSSRQYLARFYSNFRFLFSTTGTRGVMRIVYDFFVPSSIFWLVRRYLFSFETLQFLFSAAFTCRFDYLAVLLGFEALLGVCRSGRRCSLESTFLAAMHSSCSVSLASGVTNPSAFHCTAGSRRQTVFEWAALFAFVLVCYFRAWRASAFSAAALLARVFIRWVIGAYSVIWNWEEFLMWFLSVLYSSSLNSNVKIVEIDSVFDFS